MALALTILFSTNILNMMEIILYFFLLLIYLKTPIFKNYRKTTSFRFNFIIILLSIILFLYSCVMIIINPKYIFGINLENLNVRKSVLLLYICTFVTFFSFTLRDYYKHVIINQKPLDGDKGKRGNRGNSGKKSNCKPEECVKGICYKRLNTFLSSVYSNYLKKKNSKKHNSQFTNKFIISKMNKLCKSEQMDSLIKEKGAKQAYLYVQDIWKKWLHIILKYENGELFLESESLTDNDFNHMITDSDKLYASFDTIDEPGTPSKGLESPFDEIKKYDMWYWGEKKEAMPKIIYNCDSDNNNKLKIASLNETEPLWDSSNARQSYINFGELKNSKCYQKMKYVQNLQKGNKKIKIYRPIEIQKDNETYKSLGDIVNEPNEQLKTNLVAGDVKEPIDFKRLYISERRLGYSLNNKSYSFWEPIPPKNYTCLGDVMSKNTRKPDPSSVVCVPSKCVRKKKTKVINKWNSKDDKKCVSECDCNLEYNNLANIDTDNIENNTIEMYSNNNNIFKINNKKMYEIIPENETGDNGELSCLGNKEDNSYWKVEKKNDKKYSIFSIYDSE